MPNLKILAINFYMAGEEAEVVPFLSNRSLADADIIIYDLVFPISPKWQQDEHDRYKLNPIESVKFNNAIVHWSQELINALSQGKTVFLYLSSPQTITLTPSGKTPNSYAVMPVAAIAQPKSGFHMLLTKSAKIFRNYWNTFQKDMQYEVQLTGDIANPLLTTKTGEHTVAAHFKVDQGNLFLLPSFSIPKLQFLLHPTLDVDKGLQVAYKWSDNGIAFGKKLLDNLIKIHKTLQKEQNVTPPPKWTLENTFKFAKEIYVQKKLDEIEKQIQSLQQEKADYEAQVAGLTDVRRLLYETGDELEDAILKALRLLGFVADKYQDEIYEFDEVFISTEGHFLGEAEGKDHDWINYEKILQLKENLEVYFHLKELEEYPKGVLFGNAYRLDELSTRSEYFTDRAVISASAGNIALVRTPDLFEIAKYLHENDDPDFALHCRLAIKNTSGTVVKFPSIPSSEN